MKINVLGTRGNVKPFAEGYQKHTGILIDDTLLFDVGEQEYLQTKPKAIVFTHYHPDHAFFAFKNELFRCTIPHFGPEHHPLLPDVQVITKEFELEGYHITPISVLHAFKLKSLGYLIQKNNKRVFLTGDVAWIENSQRDKLHNLDLICTEATFIKKGGRINRKEGKIFGHTGVPDLIRMLSPHTSRILFAHYGQWFFSSDSSGLDMIRALAPEGVELIPARDGFSIEI